MSNLITYSNTSQYAVGGPWEPTRANFPALAHFFKCNEPSTAATLSCSISGVGVTDGTNFEVTNNGDGTITLGVAKNVLIGSWTPPMTKNILLMWSGKPSNTNSLLTVGSVAASTNRGFRNSAGATAPAVVGDGAAAVITGTAGLTGTGSQYQARAMTITWNNATGIAPYDWDGTTWTARAAAGDLATTPQTGITTMDAAVVFSANMRPAFIQVWYFTTLPLAAEIKSALLWTHAYATTQSLGYQKLAYPGFSGRI